MQNIMEGFAPRVSDCVQTLNESGAKASQSGRWGRNPALALFLAFLPLEEARSQDSEAVELPAVEIIVTPPKTKYPVTSVKKKPAAPARPAMPSQPRAPTAAPVTTTSAAPLTTSEASAVEFPAGTAIPGISIVGDIIPRGPRGEWELDGSGQVVSGAELYTSHVLNTNEALRKVTGVNVRDEEGFGLRPNIGIRGLNPTRSTKVLL